MAKKILFAFDFDWTVTNDNTDTFILKLCDDKLPDSVAKLRKETCWTYYMRAIFTYLHSIGIGRDDIIRLQRSIPLTDGILNLLHTIRDRSDTVDCVIVSDSNSEFISHILDENHISDVFDTVYTNPANFNEEGLLTIEMYGEQNFCNLCRVNICKGDVLQKHLESKKRQDVEYDRVVYVGDGINDVCPVRKLNSKGIACARKGFHLEKKLCELSPAELKCQVLAWESGRDIIDFLKQLGVF